jgi:Pyruvate/2-oxoacid:ferredoxin oxidoreductase gamma subunit
VRVTIHLRGVGGQALPFIVTMLGKRAADAGVQTTSREVFGMAQRGGAVFATLDVEAPDEDGSSSSSHETVVIGLELLEGLRGFSVLRPGERAFVSTARVIPPGSWASGAAAYPTVDEVRSIAERFGIDLTLVEATANAPWRVVQAAIDARAIPSEGRVGVKRS